MYSFCQRAVHLHSIGFELAGSLCEPNVADKTWDDRNNFSRGEPRQSCEVQCDAIEVQRRLCAAHGADAQNGNDLQDTGYKGRTSNPDQP